LTDAGQIALSRLFPRDHGRIAVRLALEAALTRHRGILENAGAADAVTLIDLAAGALMSRFVNLRVPKKPIRSIDELKFVLQQAMPGLEFVLPRIRDTGTILDLSDAAHKEKAALPLALAAGYLMGEAGRLVVPFVRRGVIKPQ
jgi:hypothetical protein